LEAILSYDADTDRYSLVSEGKIVVTRTTKANVMSVARQRGYTVALPKKVLSLVDASAESISNRPTFSINDRFEFFENFLGMVLDGVNNSIVVGGLGKTSTLSKVLARKGFSEGTDFVTIKGYSTARAMYRTLFEHNGKVIVFDDCDSVLKNETALNILKGALDSYDKRIITWASEGFGGSDDLPTCFEFTGQVVFISNIERAKIDQAILSRSLSVDVSMTRDEAIERMITILPDILPEYSLDMKEDALLFLDYHKDVCKDLNLRVLLSVVKVRANIPEDWEKNALYLISN
jgi:hypothetical protein